MLPVSVLWYDAPFFFFKKKKEVGFLLWLIWGIIDLGNNEIKKDCKSLWHA